MLGVSRDYLENMRNHLAEKGFATRIHGGIGRMPQWKTKMTVNQEVKEAVKEFLLNYAETHGLPDPGKTKRGKHNLTFLPTDLTYKSVHTEFITN